MPQKQPPDSTAVSVAPVRALSTTGAGTARGDSSARAQAADKSGSVALSASAKDRNEWDFRTPNFRTIDIVHSFELVICEAERSGALREFHRRRIHAVAQAGRLRAVVEHMTQMGVAALAGNGRTIHSEGAVAYLRDIDRRDRLPEAGPPGAGIELGVRIVERRVAANAAEQAIGFQIPGRARERCLGIGMPRHFE